MRRILVIGPGGSGKSTFAKQLGEMLGLKVIHLDSIYWKPGWVEPAKEEWAATVDKILSGEAWIIDGNYSGTFERRLAACDAVIFLDLPPLTCVWRVIGRVRRYRNSTRPDMAPGCPERFSLKFLLWIWNYRRRTRPRILRVLNASRVKLIRLRSSEEVDQILMRVADELCPT
jgi:adenylate kinase family enzyme